MLFKKCEGLTFFQQKWELGPLSPQPHPLDMKFTNIFSTGEHIYRGTLHSLYQCCIVVDLCSPVLALSLSRNATLLVALRDRERDRTGLWTFVAQIRVPKWSELLSEK